MKQIQTYLCMLVLVALMAVPTHAKIISVSGPNSSRGFAPAIIGAPTDLLEKCITNDGMQGFDEAQGIITTVDHATDDGVIPSGTVVNSHMIFLNSDAEAGGLSHRNVIWTFDGAIIGVMSDRRGNLEAASTFELGNPGTNYTIVPTAPDTTSCGTNDVTGERAAPYGARGLEAQNKCVNGDEGYSVLGDSIQVCMGVSEPGDWIRVITNPDVEAFVTRFYQQCLGREPDQEGLNNWTNALLDGSISGADVANGFIFSQEFINRNTSNEEFITILYRAFFDREPDTDGFNGWLGFLNSGASRADVLDGFIYSVEFENLCNNYGITPYSS